MEHLPDWNKPGSFSAGRDPLGLQAASVRLYTSLLPGLTNVTNRLRYFSFYCWVVRQFELKKHTSVERQWSKFIRRAEAAYVLACINGDWDETYGMAGSTWAAKNLEPEESFDFTPWTDAPGEDNQYLKAKWGNFGQFWVASMQQIGMLERTDDRVQIVTQDLGLKFAEAFESACPNACSLLLDAIEKGTLGTKDCKVISDEAHPSHLSPSSKETELLIAYLTGSLEGDDTAAARQASLWNIVNIIAQTGVADADSLRRELYVQDNTVSVKSGPLLANLKSWRAYFVNELCHIALELLLNALTYRIDAAGGEQVDNLVWHLANDALQGSEEGSARLVEFAAKAAFEDLSVEHDAGLALSEAAENSSTPDKDQIRLAISLILSLWRRWGADEILQDKLREATIHGRSAFGIFRMLDDLAGETTSHAISAVLRKYLVANHLIIAGQKLAGGTYTYRFIVDEMGLVEGVPAEYTFTNPRIGNLLTFAYDARLIEDGKLTSTGEAFHNAL